MTTYSIVRTHRASYDGMGGTERDWHAEVTRDDGEQLIIIRKWRWRLERALTAQALDKAFAQLAERQREHAPRHFIVRSESVTPAPVRSSNESDAPPEAPA